MQAFAQWLLIIEQEFRGRIRLEKKIVNLTPLFENIRCPDTEKVVDEEHAGYHSGVEYEIEF